MSRLGGFFRALLSPDEGADYDRLRGAPPADLYEAVAMQLATYRQNKPTYPDADVGTLSGGQQRMALIARCVSLISDAAGVAPLKVYDEANDDAEILDHPMRRLMRRPNPEMGPSQFVGIVAARASLAGFCVIEKEYNNAGDVIALWPLEPDRCRAKLRSQSAPAWEYRISGSSVPYTFEPEEVIHFTWRDRFDGSPYGLGALEPAIREMALLNNMTDFLKVLFEHGGVPLYGLIPAAGAGPVDQTKADAMQERFQRRHGGLKNAAAPMILSGIQDVKRLAFDMNELALVSIRDLSDVAICQAFGVPPHKAGTRVGLEHTTENATAEVEDGSFYRDTMIPFWTRLDETLTRSLLPDFLTPAELQRGSIAIAFDTSDIAALQDDRDAKAVWIMQMVNAGIMTAHTAATELGVPKPDGEDFFTRSFTVEIIPASDPLGLAADAKAAKQLPPPQAEAPQLSAGPAYERYAKRVKIGAANKRAIGAVADRSKPKVSAFFKAQSERIVGKIDLSAVGTAEHYTVAGIDWQREEQELAKVMRQLYTLAGQTAYTGVNDQLGTAISFDLANPKLGKVRTLLAHQVKDITDESKTIVQDVVTNGLAEGKTAAEIRDALHERMSTWSTSRAQTVARTESMLSFNHASLAGYREGGVSDRLQLFDNPDHDSDPLPPTNTTCADRDGMVVSIDAGEDYIASAHPNCQLALAAILTGEEV